MVKAVLSSRINSGYDDEPGRHYHFPRTYLRAVEAAVGDAAIFYQPRRGGGGDSQSYYGTATIMGVRTDPDNPELFYADLSGYIDFDRKVPFRESGQYYEIGLQRSDGGTSKGAFGRAVRLLAETEFQAILSAGFDTEPQWPEAGDTDANTTGFGEPEQAPLQYDRPSVVLTRSFRDRMFARHVQRAYDRRCAVTGLRLLNGGGRPEVQAAHIRPVALDGPDSVRNGLALSATVHWMFDRGLMTFEDDFSIRVVRSAVPEPLLGLINPTGRLLCPSNPEHLPNRAYLRFHREVIFKG